MKIYHFLQCNQLLGLCSFYFSGSQWTILSRHLVEDLLDPSKHSEAWKKYNFYMATLAIPDESYIPSFVANSGHQYHR